MEIIRTHLVYGDPHDKSGHFIRSTLHDNLCFNAAAHGHNENSYKDKNLFHANHLHLIYFAQTLNTTHPTAKQASTLTRMFASAHMLFPS